MVTKAKSGSYTHKTVMVNGEECLVRPVRMNGKMYAYWDYTHNSGQEMELVSYSNGKPIPWQAI